VVGKLLIGGVLALALAAPAAAQRVVLMPGVTYEKDVEFTSHGPVAIHVVIGPRPSGLYALKPVLSNEAIIGRETVSSMEKRQRLSATTVGVNGDLFNWSTGRPSGVFMRDRVVANPPYGDRSSVGVTDDGSLDIRRVEFFGTWQGNGQRRVLNELNKPPAANGTSLYTPAYGPATPVQPGTVEAVLDPLPPTVANTDLSALVTQVRGGGNTPIPRTGGVLVARGTTAQRLAEEAPPGSVVVTRLIFRPDWSTVADAIGGGPVVVRDGGAVFRANEAFTPDQLSPRNPRTGVGQLADGRIIFVVIDGRETGYSVGMTAFELAQTMVRLGAVTASALDAGGSSTLAFDGTVLNKPSDPGGERPVASALMLMYYGIVAAPPKEAVLSPNGDGVAEQQALSYKVVALSTVTETLLAPDGSTAFTQTVTRTPGTYRVAFPPSEIPVPGSSKVKARAAQDVEEGAWKLTVDSVDDQTRISSASQEFTVNNTLGFLKLSRNRFVLHPGGTLRLNAGVTLTRPARVTVTVETPGGVLLRRLSRRVFQPGRAVWSWDGHTVGGKAYAYSGSYLIHISAQNGLGTVDLARPFTLLRAAPAKKPRPARK
jgi:Phosphodiester glycosidase